MVIIAHTITAITASIEAMLLHHTALRLCRMRVVLCLSLVMSVEIVATRHNERAPAGYAFSKLDRSAESGIFSRECFSFDTCPFQSRLIGINMLGILIT